MHIPDGLIALPVSVAAVAVAAPIVAASTHRAGRQLVDREIPVAGLVVAYLVVAQLLVFPVGLGTSAHLVGAALALVLVGPAVAITCVSIVLVIQALVLADGGITALGLNALNSGIVPILVGWLVLVVVLRLAGGRRTALPLAAGFAAAAGVVAGAAAFCLEYAAGGPDAIPVGQVAAGMLGGHLVIAAIEGVLTALLVAAVLRLRPDLVTRWRPTPARSPELIS